MNRCVISELGRALPGSLAPVAALTAALTAGLTAALSVPAAQAADAPPPVAVVFWTAGDCVWCKVWKTGDRHEEFQAEATRLGVRLVTVSKPSLRSPDSEFRGPDGSEPTLAAAPFDAAPKLLPSFDFLCQGKPVRRLAGMADWDSFWRSQVRQMARECRPTPRS